MASASPSPVEVPPAAEDSSRLEHVWWSRSADYVFIDRVLLIVILAMAVFFELTHHAVQNCVKHFSRSNTRFNLKLWHQVNAEFMVLGFIAFVLWVSERAGGLESLVEAISSPNNAADLLHIVEDVHMRLFMSMVLYFVVMAWVILNASRYMHVWAKAEEIVHLKLSPAEHSLRKQDSRVQSFLDLREKFVRHLVTLHLEDGITRKELTMDELERFNFAAYLIKTLEKVLLELVRIHIVSWIGTAVVTMTVALIIKYVYSISDYDVFWTMCGIELGILFVLTCLAIFVEVAYRRAHTGAEFSTGCIAKLSAVANEKVMARIIQVATFYGCYTLIYFATSQDARIYFTRDEATFFVGGPTDKAVTLGPFLGVYIAVFVIINFLILPLMLPRFSVVFRTPPFFDKYEKMEVFRILYQQYHTGFFKKLFRKNEKKELFDDATKELLYGEHHKHGFLAALRQLVKSSSNTYSADDIERQLFSRSSSSMSGGEAQQTTMDTLTTTESSSSSSDSSSDS